MMLSRIFSHFRVKRSSVVSPESSGLGKANDKDDPSLLTHSTGSSQKSQESLFVESHFRSDSTARDFNYRLHTPNLRGGIRFTATTLNATKLTDELFSGTKSIGLGEDTIWRKMIKLGLGPEEANVFVTILKHDLMAANSTLLKQEHVLSYLDYYFSKVVKVDNDFDFGFAFLDQNSDGKISLEEFSAFIELFWNKKIENILSVEHGRTEFSKFIEKQSCSEVFNFYMLAKRILKKPYMSQEKFEMIKNRFIVEGAPEEINISGKLREFLLTYKEDNDLGEVKTVVLKEVALDMLHLLQQKVDLFTEMQSEKQLMESGQVLLSNSVAQKTWSKTLKRKYKASKMRSESFVSFSGVTEQIDLDDDNSIRSKFKVEKQNEEAYMDHDNFRDFLNKNLKVLSFISDARKLFMKCYNISNRLLDQDEIETLLSKMHDN